MPQHRSLRGRLRRLRDHLKGNTRDPNAFHPSLRRELEDWNSVAEQALKLVGAGLVQSWEVNLAEVRPILVAVNGAEQATEMVNRWSDALVPLETPFQAIIRSCPRLLAKGLAEAEESGLLAPLTDTFLDRIEKLGPLTSDGWARALNHVGPILDTLNDPAAIKTRISLEGPKLGRDLARSHQELRQAIDQAGHSDRVGTALFHAIDIWKDAVIRSFEFAVAAQMEAIQASHAPG
jgi:hypothetical protein